MKRLLFKTMIAVLVLLTGGVNAAWAEVGEVTTNVDIDFSDITEAFTPIDCTDMVSTTDWLSDQGNVGSVTLDEIAQKEQYNGNTTENITGNVLYQTVSGLDNGTYTVELYANASFTSGRGFTSPITDGDLGRVVVFAGDVEKTIPVFDQYWVSTNNIVDLENVIVSDGTLTMGLKKIAPGSNWHTIQIKSLTQTSDQTISNEEAQNTYWADIAATIATYAAYGNVDGVERANLTGAETKADVQSAIPTFYAAKDIYDFYAAYKNVELPYADAADNPEIYTVETIVSSLRSYYESNARAAGVEGAMNMTNYITNPKAEDDIYGWTLDKGTINKGYIDVKDAEPWTSADGSSNHKYFDGGSWVDNAWDVTWSQDVTLPTGKYLLTVKSRGAEGVDMKLMAGDKSQELPAIGAVGGLFNRGWNDTFVEFDVTEESPVTIGVNGIASTEHLWMSFSDFRLVRLGNLDVAPMDTISLTSDMFYIWDGDGADANMVSDANVDFNIGSELVGGSLVVGTSSVFWQTYADLTGSSKIQFEGTPGLMLRVLMNRVEDNENNGEFVERNPIIGEDGMAELDLTDLSYVHLNAVKIGYGGPNGTITAINLILSPDPLAIPKEALKRTISIAKSQSPVAMTEDSFAMLTEAIAAAENAQNAVDATNESLAAAKTVLEEVIDGLTLAEGYSYLTKEMFMTWESHDDTDGIAQNGCAYVLNIGSGLPYGLSTVDWLNYANLSEYDQLIVTVTDGTPRFCFNRIEDQGMDNDDESLSKMIDIPTNARNTAAYETVNGNTYTIDLKKMTADKGFAHLHSIKSAIYGNDVTVTGMYLFKETMSEADVTITAIDVPERVAMGIPVEVKVTVNSKINLNDAVVSLQLEEFAAGTSEPIDIVANESTVITIVMNANESTFVEDYYMLSATLSYDGLEGDPIGCADEMKPTVFLCNGVLLGDPNGDYAVTVSDAVLTVSFALAALEPTEAQFDAADVNADNDITVSDAVEIVNMVIYAASDSIDGARLMTQGVNYLTQDGMKIGLVNTTDFVGFQMDVTLGDDAVLNGVRLTERASSLQLFTHRIDQDKWRIIALSFDGTVISGSEGSLLSLDITGNGAVSISGVEFTDVAAQVYKLGIETPTDINASLYDNKVEDEVYSISGVRNNGLRQGVNVVRLADGQVRKVLVK